jgi:cholest-4-en-3-one 26-monooxygenase
VTTPVDLGDHDSFLAGVPHDAFAALRRDDPVHWQDDHLGGGYWNVTRYADVVRVSRDAATFSSWVGGTQIETPEAGILEQTRALMLNMDPPDHTKLRLLVNRGFTPRMIKRLEDGVRSGARDLVDRVCEAGTCDLVEDVAAELPLQVMGELLGVPAEDRHAVLAWTNNQSGNNDPEYRTGDENAGLQSMISMLGYAAGLAQRKRAEPGDDIMTSLLHAQVDGDALGDTEFQMFFLLLAVAGNETTRNLVAQGVLALLEQPDQLERLRHDPALLPTAVEELLRWVTPVMHFRRTATRDVDVAGQRIHRGDRVVIWYVSANRDEEVFPAAASLDIGRQPNPHVSFGATGPHFCLGAHLGRLEAQVLLHEIVTRMPELALAGPPARLRSNFINGLKHLPVTFEPSAARATAAVGGEG